MPKSNIDQISEGGLGYFGLKTKIQTDITVFTHIICASV